MYLWNFSFWQSTMENTHVIMFKRVNSATDTVSECFLGRRSFIFRLLMLLVVNALAVNGDTLKKWLLVEREWLCCCVVNSRVFGRIEREWRCCCVVNSRVFGRIFWRWLLILFTPLFFWHGSCGGIDQWWLLMVRSHLISAVLVFDVEWTCGVVVMWWWNEWI